MTGSSVDLTVGGHPTCGSVSTAKQPAGMDYGSLQRTPSEDRRYGAQYNLRYVLAKRALGRSPFSARLPSQRISKS